MSLMMLNCEPYFFFMSPISPSSSMGSSNWTVSFVVPFEDVWVFRAPPLEKAPRAPLVELLPRDEAVLLSRSDMGVTVAVHSGQARKCNFGLDGEEEFNGEGEGQAGRCNRQVCEMMMVQDNELEGFLAGWLFGWCWLDRKRDLCFRNP